MLNPGPKYIHLQPSADLPAISFDAPFKTVIAAEVEVDSRWMYAVCGWLIDAGCLYIMAWGPQGSAWDDAGDFANLERHNFGEIPDEKLVMTTWHDHESLADVFRFCRSSAHHCYVPLVHDLIVHIAPEPNSENILISFASQAS